MGAALLTKASAPDPRQAPTRRSSSLPESVMMVMGPARSRKF
jgi:hypothetical protein